LKTIVISLTFNLGMPVGYRVRFKLALTMLRIHSRHLYRIFKVQNGGFWWPWRGRIWGCLLDSSPAMRTSINTTVLWEYVRILAVPFVKRKTTQMFILSLNAVL